MGANCCKCKEGSVVSDNHSDRLGYLKGQAAAKSTLGLQVESLEGTRDAVKENFVSVVLEQGESSNANTSIRNIDQDGYRASNTLWTTGTFSDPIPDGFYSVIPGERLKFFENIPTLDKLGVLGDGCLKGDVISIDFNNDKMLNKLKQLVTALVKGLNQAATIKKIAGLIATAYEEQNLEIPEKARQSFESRRIQLLGDIKLVSSRSRAIMFKALADHVHLESRIILGYPSDPESSAIVDSDDQMYVVVMHNTEEMMVDLMQSPGELIRLERIDHESSENDENLPEHMLLEPSELQGSISSTAMKEL